MKYLFNLFVFSCLTFYMTAQVSSSVNDSSYQYIYNNNTWELTSKKHFEYNSNLLELSFKESYLKNNTWQDSLRYIYQYDADDIDTVQITQYFDSKTSSWLNLAKEKYLLDFLDYDSVDIQYNWNPQTLKWVANQKYVYTRTAYEEDSLEFIYNMVNGNWVENERYLINPYYTTNGDDSLYVYSTYNSLKKLYERNDNYYYEYDPQDNLVLEVRSFWNGSSWDNYQKTEYFYDQNNNDTLRIISMWNGNAWTLSQKIRNFYGVYEISGIKEIENKTNILFQIYPNPVIDNLVIKSDKNLMISIVDVLGNNIVNQNINPGVTTLNTDCFLSGNLYFIQSYDDLGNRYTQKTLKK